MAASTLKRLRRIALTGAVLAVAGCATAPSGTQVAEADPVAAAHSHLAALEARLGGPPWPAGPEWVRTTSADIYIDNIDSRIEALELRSDAAALRERAALLWYRYRIIGRIGDVDAALELVERAIERTPDEPLALMLRGAIRAGLHRFDEARADLERAALSDPEALRSLDELDLASGRHRTLAQNLAQRDPASEGLYELALRGNLALQEGDAEGAERWFRLAQSRDRDVSPMPLAWLHTQQGIALLRLGDLERANRFFDAAHRRLPQYYLAAEHLAETEFLLGRAERARELYRAVVAQTDHPEFHAALAEVEAELGDEVAAAASMHRAREGYADLLQRHGAAFADHAASFYLEIGEPQRALELAELNLQGRQDVMSWLLLAEAHAAVGQRRNACRALREARRSGLNPPELAEVAADIGRCRG
jgi:tetratricopeptide (TPR) repeat protein